jgi:hypothetical protein
MQSKLPGAQRMAAVLDMRRLLQRKLSSYLTETIHMDFEFNNRHNTCGKRRFKRFAPASLNVCLGIIGH